MFGNKLKVSLYRYNPEEDKFPYMKEYTIDKPERDIMVLDLLHLLKENDRGAPTFPQDMLPTLKVFTNPS